MLADGRIRMQHKRIFTELFEAYAVLWREISPRQ